MNMLDCADTKKMVCALAEQIKESGFVPDALVCVSRGGVIPAQLLAPRLAIQELYYIGVEYDDAGALHTYTYPHEQITGKKLLIVSDIVITGKRMQEVQTYCAQGDNECKTATMLAVSQLNNKPDFVAKVLDEIVRFPWDRREEVAIRQKRYEDAY